MLMAFRNQDRKLMNARDVARNEKPFYCPDCAAEVVLRQGEINIPHYAHKPPVTCKYGLGESEEHRVCKTAIYDALSLLPGVEKLALERNLKTVRPDVSCYINGVPIAIEVQCSSLSMSQLFYRTSQYADKGIYVLWLSPFDMMLTRESFTAPKWMKWLSALYFGRAYFWMGNSTGRDESLAINPVHFANTYTYVEETRWGGGYYKRLKNTRRSLFAPTLHLIEDFRPKRRDEWSSDTMTLPAASLYMDNLEKWW